MLLHSTSELCGKMRMCYPSAVDLNELFRSFNLSGMPRVRFNAGVNASDADAEDAKLRTKEIFGCDKQFK